MPSEILTIHIGQFGVQMTSSLWEMMCMEHAINLEGQQTDNEQEMENSRIFFQEVNNNRLMPRAILVDSEPSVIDEIKNSPFRGLFAPDSMIYCFEDSASNFARGSFLCGSKCIKIFKQIVRKAIEQVDNGLDGIAVINSLGGGAGSGMGALFMQQMWTDYPKITKIQFNNLPSMVMSTSVVEAYNSIFHMQTTIETGDMAVLFDNEALYTMCRTLLNRNSPTYSDLNRIITLMMCSATASLRFKSSLHSGLKEMHTNLIPYPRIHHTLIRHAPLRPNSHISYENPTTESITRQVFLSSHQSLKCDVNKGFYISVALNYRGLVTPTEVNPILQKIRKEMPFKFVDWVPTGFKLGVIHQVATYSPSADMEYSDKTVTIIANNTAVRHNWACINRKYDILMAKRAFMFWYINEGMEETEFYECRMGSQLLVEDYQEIEMSEEEILNELSKNPSRTRTISIRQPPTNDDTNEET